MLLICAVGLRRVQSP